MLVACLTVLGAGGSAWAHGCCGQEEPERETQASSERDVDMRHSMVATDECCDEPVGEDCPCDSGCEDCSCSGCRVASAPVSPGAMNAGEGSWPARDGGELAFEFAEQVTGRDGAWDLLRPPIA